MSEIPSTPHHYGVYLQTVVEELELEVAMLQKEKQKRMQIPFDDPFLEKVCLGNLPLWDKFTTYQKRKAMKELEWWILVINKNL